MDDVGGAATVVLVRGRRRLPLGRIEPGGCPLAAVDDLARLRLAAARFGWSVRLEGAGDDLVELLDLCGLADLFGR